MKRISTVCFALVLTGVAPLSAAVITMTGATFTGSSSTDRTITGFTAGSNSSGGNTLIGATTTNATTSDGYYYKITDPVTGNVALTGLDATAGTLNTNVGTDFTLGGIALTDVLFLMEYDFSQDNNMQNDDITLAPIDNTGTPIGTYTLTLSNIGSGTAPGLLNPGTLVRKPSGSFLNQNLYGVTFTLGDFTGDTASLAGAVGVSIITNTATDVAVVGRVVPEPTAIAMLLGGMGLLFLKRRRPGQN